MSNDIKRQNLQLFMDLSEEEQEVVSAGNSFLLQKTDIETFAINESNISDGDYSFSTKQETGYALSQTTIGFSGKGNSLSFCDKLFLMLLLA
jgi:hypothetical protein